MDSSGRHSSIMAKKTRKTQVTVSRLKSFLSFSDSFGSGFASGWKTVRGSWSASAGTATAADTNYPIRTVQMTNQNVTITLKDPGVGTGAALWVSDSGTWWSVVSKQETCSGCGACSSYNPYNPCGSGGTCVGTGGGCIGTGGNCNGASGNCVGSGGNAVPCSGCSTTVPVSGNPASSYTCSMYNPGGSCKYGYTYSYTNPSYSYSYYNSCCSGGYYNPYNPCAYTNPYNPCASTNPYNPCGATNPYNPCGYTNPCVGTGGSCASYANTYPRYLKLYKYASNTLSEIASVTLDSITSFSAIRAIKVAITNSNKTNGTATVTAKAFSDTSAVTQIGSDLVHNATGVTIVTNYGIIASDSAYNQSLSTDEITIQ
jgi:hypothetical protein